MAWVTGVRGGGVPLIGGKQVEFHDVEGRGVARLDRLSRLPTRHGQPQVARDRQTTRQVGAVIAKHAEHAPVAKLPAIAVAVAAAVEESQAWCRREHHPPGGEDRAVGIRPARTVQHDRLVVGGVVPLEKEYVEDRLTRPGWPCDACAREGHGRPVGIAAGRLVGEPFSGRRFVEFKIERSLALDHRQFSREYFSCREEHDPGNARQPSGHRFPLVAIPRRPAGTTGTTPLTLSIGRRPHNHENRQASASGAQGGATWANFTGFLGPAPRC